MTTLADLRSQLPDELRGLDDEHALRYIQSEYYPDRPLEDIRGALGVQAPRAPVAQFSSGFRRSFQELPGLALGVAGYAADVAGEPQMRDSLMAKAKAREQALGQAHADDAASFSDAWDGKTAWLDFLKNGAGYVAGQALQTVLTGGAGGLGAKVIARSGAKELAEAAAARSIAQGGTAAEARTAAIEALSRSQANAFNVGAAAGAGAHNLGMELGSIYPEALQTALDQGRQLDAGDLMRVIAAASLAAGIDTAGEAIMANRIFKGSASGASSVLRRAAREVPEGMIREGATEAIQTGLEHYGADQPIADAKGLRDIIDSAALGVLGGGMGGGLASIHAKPQEQLQRASEQAMRDITTARTEDEAVEAFQRSQTAFVPPVPEIDREGAMERLRGATPGPAPTATIDPETGELVPAPTFKERLDALRAELEDSRVRQHIRETSGPDALNDVLHYVNAADNPNLPGVTSDRMLALAETLLFRARTQPVPGTGGPVATTPLQLEGPRAIGVDTTPTGRMLAGAAGVRPEVRADVISAADEARGSSPIQLPRLGPAEREALSTPTGAAPVATPAAAAPPPPPIAPPGNAPKGAFATKEAADAYLSSQRRNGSMRVGNKVPYQLDDGSWAFTDDQEAVDAATVERATSMKERADLLRKKTQGVEPGDLLTKDDQPYGSQQSAQARANRDGGKVVPVKGGWVVRPGEAGEPDAGGTVLQGDGGAYATITVDENTGKIKVKHVGPDGTVLSMLTAGNMERARFEAEKKLGRVPPGTPYSPAGVPREPQQGASNATRQDRQEGQRGQEHPPTEEGRLPAEAERRNRDVAHGSGQEEGGQAPVVEQVQPGEKGIQRQRQDPRIKKYLQAKRPPEDETQQIISYRTETNVAFNEAVADDANAEITDFLHGENEWAMARLRQLAPDVAKHFEVQGADRYTIERTIARHDAEAQLRRGEGSAWDGVERMPPEKVLPTPEKTVRAGKDLVPAGEVLSPEAAQARIEEWKAYAKSLKDSGVNEKRVILSLFDRTGAWSQPYADAGFVVIRYDTAHGDDLLLNFPIIDINELRTNDEGFEIVGVLAAPPCTSFAASGARWWADEHDKANQKMVEKKYGYEASRYFDTPLDYANTLIAATQAIIEFARPTWFHTLENPVGRIADQNDLPPPLLTFDPNQFGDPYTKKTQLWGDFNPQLPTANVEPTKGSMVTTILSSKDPRRSATPEGFAYAFFMANHTAPSATASATAAVPQGSLKERADEVKARNKTEKQTGQALGARLEALRDAARKAARERALRERGGDAISAGKWLNSKAGKAALDAAFDKELTARKGQADKILRQIEALPAIGPGFDRKAAWPTAHPLATPRMPNGPPEEAAAKPVGADAIDFTLSKELGIDRGVIADALYTGHYTPEQVRAIVEADPDNAVENLKDAGALPYPKNAQGYKDQLHAKTMVAALIGLDKPPADLAAQWIGMKHAERVDAAMRAGLATDKGDYSQAGKPWDALTDRERKQLTPVLTRTTTAEKKQRPPSRGELSLMSALAPNVPAHREALEQHDEAVKQREVKQRDTRKASERARQRMKLTKDDTMLQALAKLGGIQRDAVAKEFGLKPEELKTRVSVGGLHGYPFRASGGMDLDTALEALTEAGYFAGVPEEDVRNVFEEAIYQELGGTPRLTPEGHARAGQAELTEREAEAPMRLDTDERHERTEIAASVGVTTTELAELDDDEIDLFGGSDDAAGTMRALGFTEEEIADETAGQEDRAQADEAGTSASPSPDEPGGGEPGAAPATDQGTQADHAEVTRASAVELRKRVKILEALRECLG